MKPHDKSHDSTSRFNQGCSGTRANGANCQKVSLSASFSMNAVSRAWNGQVLVIRTLKNCS
jgi:hypothetical protein